MESLFSRYARKAPNGPIVAVVPRHMVERIVTAIEWKGAKITDVSRCQPFLGPFGLAFLNLYLGRDQNGEDIVLHQGRDHFVIYGEMR